MTYQRPHTKRPRNRCSSGTSTRRSTHSRRGKSWFCNSVSASDTDISTPWPKSASNCRSVVNGFARSKTRHCKNYGGSMATVSTHTTRSSRARTSPASQCASPTRLRAVVGRGRPQDYLPLFERDVRDHSGAAVRVAVENALCLGHILRLVDDQRPSVVCPRTGHRELSRIE